MVVPEGNLFVLQVLSFMAKNERANIRKRQTAA